MPTGSFTLDELYGPQEVEGVKLVPAHRTPRGRRGSSPSSRTTYQVGSDVDGMLPKDKTLQDLIVKAAQRYGVPEEYGLALAQQESGYNPSAKNDEFGAGGMFQYIPETAKARGIDPFDPAQATDAAMKDFAERMKAGGVEEAIQSHFAGPGGGNRGAKTRQYLADVSKRASDIAKALGKVGGTDAGTIVTGSTDEDRNVQPQVSDDTPTGYSLDELYGSTPESIEEVEDKPFSERALGALGNAGEAVAKAAKGSARHIKNRLMTDLGLVPVDSPDYTPRQGEADPFGEGRDIQARKDVAAIPPEEQKPGFLANVENPVKLMLEDSLPANFVESLVSAPENERTAFMSARKTMMQDKIVANPDQYPAVAVDAAKAAIAARKKEQDPTIRAQWDALKQAAVEDPGKFGAQLVNSLMADPELLAVPLGFGAKPIAATRALITGAETTSRMIKTADSILDAGSLGAALNTAITAADQLSTSTTLNTDELKFSAAAGALIGGPLGVIFSRGARAKMLDLDRAKINGTYEDILRDAAKYDVEVEAAAAGEIMPSTTLDVQARINRALGITSKTDTEKYIAQRRADVKSAFKNDSDYADYQSFKAEERILRSQQYAEERAASDRSATRDARRSSIAQARAERAAAARSSELQRQFDEAVTARDSAEAKGQWDEALKINKNLDDLARMDEDDAIQSAYDKDVPAIKRALNRADQKDAKLARSKWQRGDVDQELLLRGGIAAGGAAAGFALAPEELKAEGGLLGGLAGLLLPAGGRVLDRMRQSGAVSLDGGIPGLVLKESQLPNEVDIIRRAKAGEQSAYSQLFDQYYGRLKRNLRQGMGSAHRRAAVDVDDIAQNTFLQAFRNLDSFEGNSQFYTWLYKIGENELNMAARKGLRRPDTSGTLSKTVDNDMAEVGELASKVEEKNPTGADTPENIAIANEVQKNIQEALDKLPEAQRQVVMLKEMEGFTEAEIATQLNVPIGTVKSRLFQGRNAVQETLRKRYGADAPKIKGQEGFVDSELISKAGKVAAIGGIGAAAGAYFADEDKRIGAAAGALVALGLSGGGRNLVRGFDSLLGASSTRILNKSPAVFKKIMTAERRTLAETHANIAKTGEFLVALNKKNKATQDVVNRALLTGEPTVIQKVLEAVGDSKLSNGYKNVRSALDSLGDKLVGLKRFKRGNFEYFPRVVKDKEGLFKAIGKEDSNNIQQALQDANVESLRQNGRPISNLEEAAIINKILFADKRSTQPGWSKDRGIEEITPELLKYYYGPAESLHTYIRSAVSDIERARFFGEYAKNMKKGDHEFLDVDRSVQNLMAEEIKSGKLSQPDAKEVSDILKARFGPGEIGEADFIRNVKNIGNIGLLGNFWSAGTQLADVGLQVYTQDLRSTLQSVIRQVTGRKHLDMRDFGLSDHISEEFANELRTTRWVNKVFKTSLFAGVDKFGKNTALNAAVIRAQRLVKGAEGENTKGIQKIADKYQAAFGDEFPKLISELKSGKITDLTRDYAFMELSRTQPISRIEMPMTYLKHPNARSYLWLKSFMMKQMDLLRRDSYNEIKKGNVAKGLKNLVEAGVVMGLSGAGTQMVKDWMRGRDVDFQWSDIPLNMFKTFGYSEYVKDKFAGVTKEEAAALREGGDKMARTKKAEPIGAIASQFVPPYKIFDEMLRGDPKSIRYLPFIGPYLVEQIKKEQALKQETQDD